MAASLQSFYSSYQKNNVTPEGDFDSVAKRNMNKLSRRRSGKLAVHLDCVENWTYATGIMGVLVEGVDVEE